MAGKKTICIVNPHSGGGKTGREWPRLRAMAEDCLGPFDVAMTAGPGDASRIARCNILAGVEVIICVGGDGTLSEVVNGCMEAKGPIRDDVLLGFVPNGTGCDFPKSLSPSLRIEDILDNMSRGNCRTIDAGRIRYRDHRGETVMRYFVNVASFGLGGEVNSRVNKMPKTIGPLFSFLAATLISLVRSGKKRIRFRMDGGEERDLTVWNIAVANGRYHGGGMLIAPDAALDDGLFNVTVIGNLGLAQVFYHLPKLYNGRISEASQVMQFTCKKLEAFSAEQVLLDVDGEQPGVLPAAIEIVPGALRILA